MLVRSVGKTNSMVEKRTGKVATRSEHRKTAKNAKALGNQTVKKRSA